MEDKQRIILPHGGYQKLRSYQTARIIYDSTITFCDRFIDKFSRTRDQMIQAARSGAQNIAEGSMASATSKKTEMNLTNVAKASLEELMLDYQDFLRQKELPLWDKDSAEAVAIRGRYKSNQQDKGDPYLIKTVNAETAANTMICLINQASFLLNRQIQKLEESYANEGGFSERLRKVRMMNRKKGKIKSDQSDRSDKSDGSDEK